MLTLLEALIFRFRFSVFEFNKFKLFSIFFFILCSTDVFSITQISETNYKTGNI